MVAPSKIDLSTLPFLVILKILLAKCFQKTMSLLVHQPRGNTSRRATASRDVPCKLLCHATVRPDRLSKRAG